MKEGKGRNRTGSLYRRWKEKKYKLDDPRARGKGSIYLRYTVSGKVIETSLKTASVTEARKKQLEIMKPLELASDTEALEQTELRLKRAINNQTEEWKKKNPPLKLDDAWSTYLKSQNRTRPGQQTLNGYATNYRMFHEWLKERFPEIVFMKDVGVREAEAYAEHLSSRKLSPNSYNHHLNSLSMVWSVLSEKAQADRNPFAWDKKSRRGIARRSVKAEEYLRRRRPLRIFEVEEILKYADQDYRMLILILVYTGQRLIDAVKLEWSAIDFDRRMIQLMPQKMARRGGDPVYIPLLPQLETELRQLKKEGRYILPRIVERCQEYAPAAQKRLKSLIKKAGIETVKQTDLETYRAVASVGAHSFRHTFITIARMAGIPDPMIMQITGHSSKEMIDLYTQFSDEMVASLAGQLLGSATGKQQLPSTFEKPSQKPLPPWAVEKVTELFDLTAKITGKRNEQAVGEIYGVLEQLI